MELFSRFHRIRLAMLPVGGWFTMDPEQAAYACKLLACDMVAPMHWGTFPILEQNTKSFKEFVARTAPRTRVLDLTPGQPLNVD
jgi:L-ascorbate metabolism protein UlaG (beta-lactamase superfamily)